MSSSSATMSSASKLLKDCLQAYPTHRAVQAKDKVFYEGILLQVRALYAAKNPTDEREIVRFKLDINGLNNVVAAKTEHIAYLDAHMESFKQGLETGAKAVEGKGVHWDAQDLLKYIKDDEHKYLEEVALYTARAHMAVCEVSAVWIETFGKEEGEGDAAESVIKGVEKMGLGEEEKKAKKEEEKEEKAEEKKTGGRLKGKARKEAKKALAGQK